MKTASKGGVVNMLWDALGPMLTRFAAQIASNTNPLITDVRNVATDAFPMTACASFLKDQQGEGLAVTVSVRGDESVLVVESDICMDDGTILAEGPSLTLSLLKEPDRVDGLVAQWLKSFDTFLLDKERDVVAATLRLD